MNLDFIYNILNRFSFFRNTRFYKFSREIIFPLIIKIISKFYRDDIDENLIVMGAHGGNAYLDNPKYLFEFLNKHSDYKLVWLTKSHDLLKKIRKKGYNAIYTYNLEAIKLLRKAKFIFFSHSFYDLLPIAFSPKSTVILAWHGTVIKRVNLELPESYIYNGWGDRFGLKLKNDQFIDYFLTPSGNKIEHNIISSSFRISIKKVIDVGYPKSDLLFNKDEDFIVNLKKYYKIPENIKRIILYCPTWRDDFNLDFPFASTELKKLNNLLEETDTLFLVKAHIFVKKSNLKDYKNIINVPENSDIQELYLITDILITDYSSTMLDFTILDRPILLYPHDLENYLEVRGMYYDLEEIAPGPLFFNAEDLIEGIKNIDKINIKYREKRIRTRDRFNKYIDGNNTERLLKFLGIKYTNNFTDNF